MIGNPAIWARSGSLFMWAWLACTALELLTRHVSRGSRADLSLVDAYVNPEEEETA